MASVSITQRRQHTFIAHCNFLLHHFLRRRLFSSFLTTRKRTEHLHLLNTHKKHQEKQTGWEERIYEVKLLKMPLILSNISGRLNSHSVSEFSGFFPVVCHLLENDEVDPFPSNFTWRPSWNCLQVLSKVNRCYENVPPFRVTQCCGLPHELINKCSKLYTQNRGHT